MAFEVGAVFSIRDNFTSTLHQAQRQQQQFRNQLTQTTRQLEPYRQQMTSTTNNIRSSVTTLANEYRRMGHTASDSMRMAWAESRRASNGIGSSLGGLKGKLSGLASSLISIKGLFAGLVGGAMFKGFTDTLKSGSMLEQQMVSMEHFVGVGNQGKSKSQVHNMSTKYLADLRKNADITPFETNEVISAGTRAINIASGNTKQAMEILKLAEDMAALNPEKSLSDSIEALADLKTGETERMKEFGFKISQDDIKKSGGNINNIKNGQGVSVKQMFAGGSEKLSKTGAGLFSTITGGIGTAVTNAGFKMLEAMKPTLEKIIPLMDKLSPKLNSIGDAMGKGISIALLYIGKFISFVQSKMPVINPYINDIKSNLSFMFDIWKAQFPLIKDILVTVWGVVQPILKIWWNMIMMLYDVVKAVLPSIINMLKDVWKQLKPVLEGVQKVYGYVGDKVQWVRNKVEGKNNAFGLNRVPYDGYPAILHEGERVLTKQEAKGQNGNSITIPKLADTIIVREEADIDKIANRLAYKLQEAKLTFGGVY